MTNKASFRPLKCVTVNTELSRRFIGKSIEAANFRHHLWEVCADFVASGLADENFEGELVSKDDLKFWSRISEALVYEQLKGKEFPPRAKIGKGPDFLVMAGRRKVWIEVICPGPSGVPDNWYKRPPGTVVTHPHKEILLRWTSAIKEKAEKLLGSEDGKSKGYLNSGVVSVEDAYVIAVNGCQLRGDGPASTSIFGPSNLPYAVEAAFAVGPYELQYGFRGNFINVSHLHRPFIENRNRSSVQADTFLDARFNPISAIWALDIDGSSTIKGNPEPKAVVHNPYARSKLPCGFLPADCEYFLEHEGNSYVVKKLGNNHTI